MPTSPRHSAQVSDRDAAAFGKGAPSAAKGDFASTLIARGYTRGSDDYITASESITSHSFPEAAMRAELQKLVDSIREALVLLRRHL
jgi:hypothetical protein